MTPNGAAKLSGAQQRSIKKPQTGYSKERHGLVGGEGTASIEQRMEDSWKQQYAATSRQRESNPDTIDGTRLCS